MQSYDHIIIGGGVCGVTAAETIRRRAPDASVLLIGEEAHALYSRVLLPHVVRGKVPEATAYLKSETWYADQRIDVRPGTRVVHIDAAARTVATDDGSVVGYGTLLIATGGSPKPWQFENTAMFSDAATTTADAKTPVHTTQNVGAPMHRLQTIEDARALRDVRVFSADAAQVVTADAAHSDETATMQKTAAVIGGGFIALEIIMSYAHHGAKVVALLRKDGFFASTLDAASKRALTNALTNAGVEVRTNVVVTAAHPSEHAILDAVPATILTIDDGTELTAHAIGLGIGIAPNIGFLEGSGISVRAGVVTDDHLRTSAAGVFAAGDVAEFLDPVAGMHRMAGNWQNALFQGRIAGENMTGGDAAISRTTAYAITCFGTPVAFVGATEREPDRRIVRERPGSITQLFITGGRIVGATCIGAFSDRAWVTERIESGGLTGDNELKSWMEG